MTRGPLTSMSADHPPSGAPTFPRFSRRARPTPSAGKQHRYHSPFSSIPSERLRIIFFSPDLPTRAAPVSAFLPAPAHLLQPLAGDQLVSLWKGVYPVPDPLPGTHRLDRDIKDLLHLNLRRPEFPGQPGNRGPHTIVLGPGHFGGLRAARGFSSPKSPTRPARNST